MRHHAVRRILVVGQTPPPYGGQAMMIAQLLQSPLPGVALQHVRMSFSKDMADLKRIRVGKLMHAIKLIASIIVARVRHRTRELYYPPSGPEMVPALRDMVILATTRWMFARTIFHFHAAGISQLYARLPAALRPLFRLAFMRPDVAIHLSSYNPDDGGFLKARRIVVVPNGIQDESGLVASQRDSTDVRVRTVGILFVGLVVESKGILVLLEAVNLLRQAGLRVSVSVVGRFANDGFAAEVRSFIAARDLCEQVEFHGVLTGEAKLRQYADADIFCLPTFFESESFSLVTVEAMSFSLPVVVSRWRGLQSVVEHGETGYIVEPHDPTGLARSLRKLVESPALRRRMGTNGRSRFLASYGLDTFRRNMADCFNERATDT